MRGFTDAVYQSSKTLVQQGEQAASFHRPCRITPIHQQTQRRNRPVATVIILRCLLQSLQEGTHVVVIPCRYLLAYLVEQFRRREVLLGEQGRRDKSGATGR